MTASDIVQLILLAVFAVLVGFAIPTIVQIRRTMRAAEELLRGAGARVESAAANLDSVLGRVDSVAGSLEAGSRGLATTLSGLGAFMGRLKSPPDAAPGAAWFAAFTNVLSGFWQAWSAYCANPTRPSGRREAAASGEKEGDHKNV